MKFIDLFAGIGGFRRGMEMAGHECAGFCEWDKFATASYISMHLLTEEQRTNIANIPVPLKKNGEPNLAKRQKEILKDEYRNGEWYADDIRNVDARNIPKCDCWCFGAPCQDFSVAGKRAGLDGDRSVLVREIFRILGEIEEENRPEWLIYENVKGMLSSNKGFDFLEILLAMDGLGYDIEWQLFNSKDWGVPQNRERVYTVGHLRRFGARKIFPVTGTDRENSISIDIIGHRRNFRRCTQIFSPDGITEAIDTATGGGRGHHTVITFGNVNPSGRGMNGNVYDSNGINPALTTNKGEGNKIAIPVLTPDRAEKRQNGRRFKGNGEEMFTLTAQDQHGVAVNVEPVGFLRNVRSEWGKQIRKQYESGEMNISRHSFLEKDIRSDGISNTIDSVQKDNYLAVRVGKTENDEHKGIYVQLSEDCTVYAIWNEKYQCYTAIRRLTPKECFRLQGWTDEYFERAKMVNSDSQLYKQAGNGVTVNVVYEIAKRIGLESEQK